MAEPTTDAINTFITRWENSGGHERGAGHQFLLEFCELLGLEKPDPPLADNERNSYTFERRVERKKPDGTIAPNWIDLYKSGHFVLETKQGVNPLRDKSDSNHRLLPALEKPALVSGGHGKRGSSAFDKALERAHAQGERYIHALPTEEGRPPFLIVCDVGHSFDLYAEFSSTGGQYERFPDPRSHRIHLKDLHKQETRDLFRKIWNDPYSLDPSRHAAEVTREVAKALADLAKSLEKDGHDPQVTAGFLQRCLFTMFAEDVGLLPEESFLKLLKIAKEKPAGFPVLLHGLWRDMDRGASFSAAIQDAVIQFNGGLFKDCSVIELRPDQIIYLIHAAKQDWSRVEPAIFGTLLERALDPRERHKLGAHYTPRSYVERLVRPTLIDPLREKWEAVRAAAAQLDDKDKRKEARATVGTFHKELAAIRVLDPACGSGNFLYVSLELIKRLEAEVLDLFEKLGGDRSLEMNSVIVRPDNFLGIELNARAAAIAQIVLWIGYFQFHRRATGKADTNDRPLLPKHNTIENRDAVLSYDSKIPRRDPETGEYVTIWDGRTTKPHPVTGKEVPDESARTNLFDYTNPKRAEWPEADYIVGNPPFIGASRMREALGDGYTECLRKALKGKVPDSADFVMYWWQKAAELLAAKKIRRFGFITTNSIHQTFNRRVLEPFLADEKKPIHLAYAIPDHPWVDSADGAAVRIAMTVADGGNAAGVLEEVIEEEARDDGENDVVLERQVGEIASNLKLGAGLGSCHALESNADLSNHGVIRGGEGFLVSRCELDSLGFNRIAGIKSHIRPIVNGSDLTGMNRDQYVIDLYGLSENQVLEKFPEIYQRVSNRVRPVRLKSKRASRRDNWWLFNESVPKLRKMLAGLERFIATSETSKHRLFVLLDSSHLPEHKLVNIAHSDCVMLGILSSTPHVVWSLATGSRLEDRPVYVKSNCFEKFPFPALEEGELKTRIRELGERLDAHRQARQAAHPALTLTGMYNVLERLRAQEPLSDKEKKIHDDGLVTVLKQIHDDLDSAVFEAYGWEDLHKERRESFRRISKEEIAGDDPSGVAGRKDSRPSLKAAPSFDWEQELLTRLVALNHERAEEERNGKIRWLRPEYQAPKETKIPAIKQQEMGLPDTESFTTEVTKTYVNLNAKLTWPKGTAAQFTEVTKLLLATGPDAELISACFGKKSKVRTAQVGEILTTLKSLGKLE